MKQDLNKRMNSAGIKRRRLASSILFALCLIASIPGIALAQSSYSLAQYQTPFRFTDGIYANPNEKGQGARGTCWAFAGVAAMEAAYKRKYGIELDLSEQYAFHMPKVMELQQRTPENNTSLAGFQGSSDIVKHLSRFAIPEERFAPYMSDTKMKQLQARLGVGNIISNQSQMGYDTFEFSEEHIPTQAGWNAKYKVTDYSQVSNPSNTGDLEQILLQDHEIVVNLNMRRKIIDALTWDYNVNAMVESHDLLLIGYDRQRQWFLAKNSWGENGIVRLSYSLVSNCVTDAYYIKDVADPNSPAQKQARFLGIWNFDDIHVNGSRVQGKLVIRRFTDLRNADPNAMIKLGSLYLKDGSGPRDVTGYFTDNGDGIVLDIRMNPGAPEDDLRFTYPIGFWSFVSKNFQPLLELGTEEFPYGNFYDGVANVPRMGTVIALPGSYPAAGLYTKPMTIKAPQGGVILGNGN